MEVSSLDVIGLWSEVKLEIVRKYARAYSQILTAQQERFYHIYIDAFAGAGWHISRTTGEMVPGSPLNALSVEPPFKEYHFIDLDSQKADSLRTSTADKKNVFVYEGDCNRLLLEEVFPRVQWQDLKRGLVLLDPYGLHLNWEVIQTAARMRSIEIFLNFPIHDINRNVLLRDPSKVDSRDLERMNAYWGDESWREVVYKTQASLFDEPVKVKQASTNRKLVAAFRKRLTEIAGFKHVPVPIPMRNSLGATVYYLFFASQKPVAADIVRDIFDKYRTGEVH